MGKIVNLNQVGVMTDGGKHYEGNGEAQGAKLNSHQAKMEGMRPGYKGASGSTFQNVSSESSQNHVHIVRHIVEQARRAVLAERAALTGDEDATTSLNTVKGTVESFTSAVSKPINI